MMSHINRPWTIVMPALAFCLLLLETQAVKGEPWQVIVRNRGGYLLYELPPSLSPEVNERRPTVVYLHGAPGLVQPWYYDGQCRDMANAGFVVVLPIYGGLPWEWYADAVGMTRWALIDVAVNRTASIQNVAFAGHSLGGTYALKMADEASRLWLPAPKAVILHDAAGFQSLPWVSPSPWTGTARWLNDLTMVPNSATLVIIASSESWNADTSNLWNGNAAGIWLRAWCNTGPAQKKRAYWVEGGHFGNVGANGPVVYNLYRDITLNALRHSFTSQPFPDPNPPNALRIDSLLSFIAAFSRP